MLTLYKINDYLKAKTLFLLEVLKSMYADLHVMVHAKVITIDYDNYDIHYRDTIYIGLYLTFLGCSSTRAVFGIRPPYP